MQSDQHSDLQWHDSDVAVSMWFEDIYFSLDDGLAETRHVFLAGNCLPQWSCSGFQIAELGFGTGLDLLLVLDLWRQSDQLGMLKYTNLEAFPMSSQAMIRVQVRFVALEEVASELVDYWQCGAAEIELSDLCLRLIKGDVRLTAPAWNGCADAYFLDGFSLVKNPKMWQNVLSAAVGTHSAENATLETYITAGLVRRRLTYAGLSVPRSSSFGQKRHMTTARLVVTL